MRDELEELKRKYNMKEPERAFMDEASALPGSRFRV